MTHLRMATMVTLGARVREGAETSLLMRVVLQQIPSSRLEIRALPRCDDVMKDWLRRRRHQTLVEHPEMSLHSMILPNRMIQ